MEIYEKVLEMTEDQIINHKLLAYDEDLYDYIKDEENIDIDFYTLFIALATEQIKNEEKIGENLKYLSKIIRKQLVKISKIIEIDIRQFIESLEFADFIIIKFMLEILIDNNDYNNLELLIEAILELDNDEDRNIEIVKILKDFISNNSNNNLLIILGTNNICTDCDFIKEMIESLMDEYEDYPEFNRELHDYYDY